MNSIVRRILYRFLGRTFTTEEKKTVFLPLFMFAQVVGLFAIILTLYWCIAWNQGFGLTAQPLFNWHPFFMTVGLIYLSGNAVIVLKVFENTHAQHLKLVHGRLNAFGIFFTLLAIIAVIQNHREENNPHFYSLHSWLGILAVLMYVVQLLAVGVYYYYFKIKFVPNTEKAAVLPYHIYIGRFTFLLGIVAALTGLNEKEIMKLQTDYALRIPSAWIINSIGTLFMLFKSIVIYIINPHNEVIGSLNGNI